MLPCRCKKIPNCFHLCTRNMLICEQTSITSSLLKPEDFDKNIGDTQFRIFCYLFFNLLANSIVQIPFSRGHLKLDIVIYFIGKLWQYLFLSATDIVGANALPDFINSSPTTNNSIGVFYRVLLMENPSWP